MIHERRLLVVAPILVATLASSCAGQSAGTQEVNGIVMMTADVSGKMDAIWEGTIALTEGGCLGLLTDAPGAEVIPVLWPAGSTITDGGESFEISGMTYRLGDSFRGGGGEDPSLPMSPEPACESDSYLILNS